MAYMNQDKKAKIAAKMKPVRVWTTIPYKSTLRVRVSSAQLGGISVLLYG